MKQYHFNIETKNNHFKVGPNGLPTVHAVPRVVLEVEQELERVLEEHLALAAVQEIIKKV